jgi:tetratricopeptide (TPR) repeat protein
MPQTTYMQRHARRDHGFTIPDPLLTVRHGIANACNRCHTDHDAAWAVEAVDKWYGTRMERPTRQRAQTIMAARQNNPSARAPLLQMLRDDKSSFWQAVAAGLLRPWASEDDVMLALTAALKHPEPLVRDQALRALEPSSVLGQTNAVVAARALLNDPSRAVRVRAAWSLRSELNTATPAGIDLLRFINFSSDQPGGLVQRSVFLRARGQDRLAAEDLRRAVTWDPNSAPIRHELAVVLSVLNQPQVAIEQLLHACQLDPKQAEYRFKLGLAYNEAGQLDKTMEALQDALRLDPAHARAWYNLGLAYNESGQADRALEALARAEALSPRDPMIPYARATILAKDGRLVEARQAAGRALEIEPNHQQARQVLDVLGP